VVSIHVGNHFRLCSDEAMRVTEIEKQIICSQIDDAPEAANEVRPLDFEGKESKIREIRIHLGVSLARKKPVARVWRMRALQPAHQRHAAARQRIAGAIAAIDEQAGTWIGLDVLSVQS